MKNLVKFNTDLKLTRSESSEDGKAAFEGFFIVYDSPAPYGIGERREQIAREAITRNLTEDKTIVCLFNHDTNLVLGSTANGTLRLEDRAEGLYGVCEVNLNDSDAVNAYERVKRGDISGCSFGAYIDWKDQDYDTDEDLVTIKSLDLIEISVCSFPFYKDTTMSARDRDAAFEEEIARKKAKALKLEYLRKKGDKRWH